MNYLEHVKTSAIEKGADPEKVTALIAATEAFADAIEAITNAREYNNPLLYPPSMRPDMNELAQAVSEAHRVLFAAAGVPYEAQGME